MATTEKDLNSTGTNILEKSNRDIFYNYLAFQKLTAQVPTSGAFQFYLKAVNVPFQPDEMIVKQITYNNGNIGTETGVYTIWMDLVNAAIGTFQNNSDSTPGNRFKISNPVSGEQRVIILNQGASSGAASPAGYLSFYLEFRKYM